MKSILKASHRYLTTLSLTCTFGLYLISGARVHAQNQTVSGHLHVTDDTTLSGTLNVTGVADLNNNTTNFGTNGGSATQPGLTLQYTDANSGTVSSITFNTSGTSAIWQWQQNSANGFIPQMTLTSTNSVILWNPTNSLSPGIILNPAGDSTFSGSITATGTNSRLPNQQAPGTDTASVLTVGLADGRYLTPAIASGTYLTTSQGDSRYLSTSSVNIPRLNNNQTYTGVNTFSSPVLQNGLQIYNSLFDKKIVDLLDVNWGTATTINNQDWIQPERMRVENSDSTTQPSWSFYSYDGTYMGQFGAYNIDSYTAHAVVPQRYAPGLHIATDRNLWITGGPTPGHAPGPYYASFDYQEGIKFYQWVEFQTHVSAIDVDMSGKLTVAGATTLSGGLQVSGAMTIADSITATGTNSRLPNQEIGTDTASILTVGGADARYLPLSSTTSPYITSTYASATYLPINPTTLNAGFQTSTTGSYSTAFGYSTIAAGSGQLVIGQYNNPLASEGDNSSNWVSNDALFVVGNGMNEGNRSNAFAISKNGDTLIAGSASIGKKLKVAGKASFSDVVTIPMSGDLSMGDFTNSGLTRAQTVAEAYFNILATSPAAKNLSDAEKENIINFLTGLDQIVGLDNVEDFWSLRSIQNAGTGTTVYGMLGKRNAILVGATQWMTSGIKIGKAVGVNGYVQLPGGAPLMENPQVTVFNCFVTHDVRGYDGYWIFDSVGLAGNPWKFPGRISGYGWTSDGVEIDCRMYGNTQGYWYQGGGVPNDTQNFFAASVHDNMTYNYSQGVLKGSYVLTPDNTTQTNPDAYTMLTGAQGHTVTYAMSSFHMILPSSITEAQHAQIYQLYKSTIGQGLGLP